MTTSPHKKTELKVIIVLWNYVKKIKKLVKQQEKERERETEGIGQKKNERKIAAGLYVDIYS